MARELQKHQLVERSITKKYRHELWNAFVQAINNYNLVEENDIILVELDGSAERVLIAKLLQHLKRISPEPFEIICCGDGDYSDVGIELEPIPSRYTKKVGSECFSDAIEKTLDSILYNSKIESIVPMENGIIRPLFCIDRDSIRAFVRYNELGYPVSDSKCEDVANLLSQLESENKGIQHSIFNSIHSLSLDTMVGYDSNGVHHSYLDNY